MNPPPVYQLPSQQMLMPFQVLEEQSLSTLLQNPTGINGKRLTPKAIRALRSQNTRLSLCQTDSKHVVLERSLCVCTFHHFQVRCVQSIGSLLQNSRNSTCTNSEGTSPVFPSPWCTRPDYSASFIHLSDAATANMPFWITTQNVVMVQTLFLGSGILWPIEIDLFFFFCGVESVTLVRILSISTSILKNPVLMVADMVTPPQWIYFTSS